MYGAPPHSAPADASAGLSGTASFDAAASASHVGFDSASAVEDGSRHMRTDSAGSQRSTQLMQAASSILSGSAAQYYAARGWSAPSSVPRHSPAVPGAPVVVPVGRHAPISLAAVIAKTKALATADSLISGPSRPEENIYPQAAPAAHADSAFEAFAGPRLDAFAGPPAATARPAPRFQATLVAHHDTLAHGRPPGSHQATHVPHASDAPSSSPIDEIAASDDAGDNGLSATGSDDSDSVERNDLGRGQGAIDGLGDDNDDGEDESFNALESTAEMLASFRAYMQRKKSKLLRQRAASAPMPVATNANARTCQ